MFEFIESLFESIILLILVYYIVYINNKTKNAQKDNLPLLKFNFGYSAISICRMNILEYSRKNLKKKTNKI